MNTKAQHKETAQDKIVMPYTYDLPPSRIALRPVYPFHDAKLIVVDRESGELSHRSFLELSDYLSENDVLVFNNSPVMKARLFGAFTDSGSTLEVLLLEEVSSGRWRCMGKPLKKFTPNRGISFGGDLKANVVERVGGYEVIIEFKEGSDPFQDGTMPIPPYIREGRGDERDIEDYQNPFSKTEEGVSFGSVAAPTAGLHFTDQLLEGVRNRGVETLEVTLHIGPASFLSAWESKDDNEDEVQLLTPGSERCVIDSSFVQQISNHRKEGKRIIAVGTTVVRYLESLSAMEEAGDGEVYSTDLFITPGYRYGVVDALITNFHQPRSTHLLLVEAFLGGELLDKTYSSALKSDYRFLSYGDGMFIL